MKTTLVSKLRERLEGTYVIPVLLAVVLEAGISGLIRALSDPLENIVARSINTVSDRVGMSLNLMVFQPNWNFFLTYAALGALLLGCGLWLGLHLYPRQGHSAAK